MDKIPYPQEVDLKKYSKDNNPKSYYGLPEEVKFCKKCVMSNQKPNSTIEFKNNIESKHLKEKINEIIDNINKNLTLVEKIKKFHVINENFTIENGLLTPTMKVKRSKVIAKYKNILENFYKN